MSGTTSNTTPKKKGSGKLILFGVVVLLLVIVGANSIFFLNEGESAIVLRFGRIESVHMSVVRDDVRAQLEARPEYLTISEGTGLRFKIPFIDNVIKYTSRLIPYESPPTEVLTRDRNRLLFDNIAVWRIINPVLFFESYDSLDRAKMRLNEVLYAEIRVDVGRHDSYEVISNREISAEMLQNLTKRVSGEFFNTGIEVLDIRISRTNLPNETFDSIHNRMNAERHRVAAENRAEGERENYRIRSETDRLVTIMITEAERDAEIIRGQGDREAARIYNEAFSRNPAFFEFYNLLATYRLTIGRGTTLVVPLDSPFAKYLLGVSFDITQMVGNIVEVPPIIQDDDNGDDD